MHELENELVKPMEWTCSEPDVHSSQGEIGKIQVLLWFKGKRSSFPPSGSR
jgi:hypothetical protein